MLRRRESRLAKDSIVNVSQLVTRAHIVVGTRSRETQSEDILLSADCRTASEIDSYADQMIKELEAIKREARTMQWSK
jgi:hypothetical protein